MTIDAMKQALDAYCKTLHPLWNTRISRTEAEGFFEAGFKAAIAEAEKQEPVALQMDVIVVNLVREGINKHRARELAEHFIKHTHPQPKREPLTNEQITKAFNEAMALRPKEASNAETNRLFVKRIEAAHGITSDIKQKHVDKTAKQRHEEKT